MGHNRDLKDAGRSRGEVSDVAMGCWGGYTRPGRDVGGLPRWWHGPRRGVGFDLCLSCSAFRQTDSHFLTQLPHEKVRK